MVTHLAALPLQQQQPQQGPGCTEKRAMQRILRHQSSKPAIEAGTTLLAAYGMEAVGEAVVLRVDGQHEWAAAGTDCHRTVCGINNCACTLQAEAMQCCLQRKHHHVGHQ